MKYLLFLIALLTNTAKAQDCKAIDAFNSFHGIKFGQAFPDSLRKYCDIDYNDTRADSNFSIWTAQIKNSKKFSSWVNVRLSFSYINFSAIKDGQIYLVQLQRPFDGYDSAFLKNGQDPLFFKEVTDELISTFGQISSEEKIIDDFDKGVIRKWKCEKVTIEFALSLLSETFTLSFMNNELDQKRKALKYSN